MAGTGHFNTSAWGQMVLDCLKKLSQHESLAGFAEERASISQTFYPQPMVNSDSIRATVIFVDEFENLVLNVNEELFERTRGQRGFHIEMKRVSPPVAKISNWYSEVDEGELLALFNRDGYLELALNRSNASGLLGVRLYDTVTILFQ
jgi:S-adenosylmethionine hydrolase